MEVSEGSYLITMDVRLPVFGKQMQLRQRDKQRSMLKQGAFQFMQQPQKYTSQRSRVDITALNNSNMDPLSVMDAFSDNQQQPS